VTSLTLALFDARGAGTSALVCRLQRSLADSVIDARVTTFDAVAPDFDASGFNAFFLRGLPSSDTADPSIQAADSALRAALCKAGFAYQVIYGDDDEWVEKITQLMSTTEKSGAARPTAAAEPSQKARDPDGGAPWLWLCDKCSDPQCEHRLLTDLLRQRQTASTG
jgi:hypothetical protein